MANAFKLFGEIEVNTRGFQHSLARAELRLRDTEKAIGDTERKAASLGKTNAVTARSYEKLNDVVKTQRDRVQQATDAFRKGEISQTRLQSVLRQTDARVNSLNSRLKDQQARLSDMPGKLQQFGSGLAAVGKWASVAAAAVGGFSVKAAMGLDDMRNRLLAATGSVDAANAKFKELNGLALKSAGVLTSFAVETYSLLKPLKTSEQNIMALIQAMGKIKLQEPNADLNKFVFNLNQLANVAELRDVREAIENFPMFGTILKEAFNLKSAENDIGGLKEELADLQKAGKLSRDAFMEAIASAINAQQNLSLLRDTFSIQFSKALEQVNIAAEPLGRALLGAVMPAMKVVTDELAKETNSRNWEGVGMALGEQLGKGIGQGLSKGIPDLADMFVKKMTSSMEGKSIPIGLQGTVSVGKGLLEGFGFEASLKGLQEAFMQFFHNTMAIGLRLATAFPRAIATAIATALFKVNSYTSEWQAAGKNATQGFIDGMTSLASKVGETAAWIMGQLPIGRAMAALQEKSPSKVFFKIGKDVAQGFIDGLNSMKVLVGESIAKMFDVSGLKLKGGKKNAPGVELLTSLLRELSQFKEVSRETEILAELTAKAYEKQDKRLTEMLIKAAKMVDAEKRKAAWLERQAELIEQLKNTELPTPQFAEGNITGQGSGDWLEKLVEDSEKLRESYNDLYPPPPMMAAWDNFWLRMNQELIKWKSSLPSLKQAIGENLIQSIYNIGDVFGNAVAQWDGTAKGFFKSLAQGFKQMIQQIIAELIRLMVVKAIMNLIGSLAGSAIGGAAGGTGSLDGHGAGVPAGMASGGFVSGKGTSTSDSIAAMLSNGEFVMSAKAVKNWGKGFFENLNSMSPQMAFAGGGYVGGSGTSTYYNNTTTSSPVFNINVQGGGTRNEQMATASMLKREVMAALEIERRRNK